MLSEMDFHMVRGVSITANWSTVVDEIIPRARDSNESIRFRWFSLAEVDRIKKLLVVEIPFPP